MSTTDGSSKPRHDHDGAYKGLFSEQHFFQDLLTGFLAAEWHGELDLDGMELMSPSHLGRDGQRRYNDVIWRVPWRGDAGGDQWLYVCIMLEFQSQIDPSMAVRMMTYLGLFYEGLLKSGAYEAGHLPPVLPVVLYNGSPRWTAPVHVSELISHYPKALEPYIPRVQYLFLDEGRMRVSEQYAERNLAAAIFKMEQEADDFGKVMDAMAAWLQAPEQASAREAAETFAFLSLYSRFPEGELPSRIKLSEVSMLDQRLKEREERRVAEGRAKGRAEGEAHALIAMVRRSVAKGRMTVDEGRAEILEMIDAGEIPRAAGEAALAQLG